MINLDENIANQNTQNQLIPLGVAEIPSETKDNEGEPYLISFANYNTKLCQIEDLIKNQPKAALKTLIMIGTSIFSIDDFKKNNIDRFPIDKSGDYSQLFSRLGEDIELMEIKLQGESRIFYFDIESKKTFYIVAILANHLETKKNKR